MVSNEQEAQQIVIRHIGGFAWPTLLLLVSSAGIYVAAVAHLLTEPSFSWWALAGIAFCTYAIYTPAARSGSRRGHRDEPRAPLDQ